MYRHSLRRANGHIEFTGFYGEREQLDTAMCVHCNGHWIWRPGSGRERGWCTRCNGWVCGPGCADCVHFLQKLDNLEAGRPAGFRPVTVSVDVEPPRATAGGVLLPPGVEG